MYEGVEIQRHTFITAVLREGEWSASCPGRFTRGERDPDTQWIGGWGGPRVGLDAVAKKKILCPCQESNPVVQTINYEVYCSTKIRSLCQMVQIRVTDMLVYEGVSKSFWTVRLERELQMIQLSGTRLSFVAIL